MRAFKVSNLFVMQLMMSFSLGIANGSTSAPCRDIFDSAELKAVQGQALQEVESQMAKAKAELVDAFGEDPANWAEISGQEQAAYSSAVNKYARFQNGRSAALKQLSLPELYSIDLYTGFLFSPINRWLFSLKAGTDIADSFKDMSGLDNGERSTRYLVPPMIAGLRKLPVFEGRVYRSSFSAMSTDPAEAMAKAKAHYEKYKEEGSAGDGESTYVFNGFLSTTKGTRAESREEFVTSASLLLFIESKSGRDISKVSNRPQEEEVLFTPFSSFTVTKKEIIYAEDGSIKQYRMYLKE